MALDIRRALAGSLLLALTACDMTFPWTSTKVEPTWVSVDTTPRTASAPADAVTVPELVVVVTSNAPQFFVQILPSPFGVAQFAGPFRDLAEIHVPLVTPSTLGVGVHSGTLWVSVAGDSPYGPYGTPIVPPVTIPFTYEVTAPTFASVVPDPAIFATYVGAGPQTLTVQVDGAVDAGPWTATLEYMMDWLDVTPTSGATLPATLTLTAIPSADRGAFGATLVLRAAGSERRVDVQMSVEEPPPTWTGGTVTLTAVSYQPAVPPPVEITLGTATGAPCAIVWVSVSYVWPNYGWLTTSTPTSIAPGPLTLQLSRTDLPPGLYDATVEVRCTYAPTSALIPVVLDMSAGDLSYPLDPLWINIEQSTTPAEATRLVTLTAARPAVAFEASALGGWLTVAPTAGTVDAAATLTIAVDRAALETGGQGNRDGAIVVRHWEADGTVIERRISVTLWMNLRELSQIVPRVVATSTAGYVAVADGADTDYVLMFGTVPAPEMVRDPGLGTVRAKVPDLPAGAYRVYIPNGMGIVRSSVWLSVLSPTTRSPAALPSPGPLARILFDDAHGALWAVSTSPGRLVRWSEGAGGWSPAGVDLPGLHDVILRDDGALLAGLAGARSVLVDPGTLVPSFPYYGGPLGPAEAAGWRWTVVPTIWRIWDFAVTSEVSGCATPGTCQLYYLDVDDGDLFGTGADLYGATGASSGDLTRAVLVRHGFASPRPFLAWSPATGLLDGQVPATEATSVTLDRTGSRVLLLDEAAAAGATATILLDGALSPIAGALPGSTAAAILSQDGSRAFTFDGAARTVRVFDLVAAPVGGLFVEVGTGVAPVEDPGAGIVLALATDERTLFVGGDAYVAVVPLP
jgi:hypothetical protein